jgi:GT2 family glycosyltransferase
MYSEATRRVLKVFQKKATLGVVSLFIINEGQGDDYPEEHWWHPFDRKKYQHETFLTNHFNEAVAVFRKEALEVVGYYYEPLFWAFEEFDLSLRLLDAGYDLLYFPEVKALHIQPRGPEKDFSRQHLNYRNKFWIATMLLPVGRCLAYIAPRLGIGFIRSLRDGYHGQYWRGVFEYIKLFPRILATRHPVSRQTLRRIRWVKSQPRLPDQMIKDSKQAEQQGLILND